VEQFVVISEQGPHWDPARAMREQEGWGDHARFMNQVADERIVVLGGPLRHPDRHRALLVVRGSDEATLRARLAADPWMVSGVLQIVAFYSWEILLGELP
jgi:uncharacterized protein YciI